MPSVLFVCTANRYRSPIAAASFQRELASRNLEAGWQVASAGTWTMDGQPAIAGAIASARSLGLELGEHRSTAISAEQVTDADLIVVMEQGQKEALGTEFPGSSQKTYLLSEVSEGIAYDIPDPVVSPWAGDIVVEIDELIRKGFDRMCTLARALAESPKQ